MAQTDNTDDTDHEASRLGTHSLAGGGELEYAIRGRENMVRGLDTDIRAAVNRRSGRYFGTSDATDRRRPPLVTRERPHPAIEEAVDEANQRPSWKKREVGDMVYVVEEAYYPDDYDHFIDLTEIDAADRAHAFMHAQGTLAERGFIINSARSDDEGRLTKLHVVRMRWIDEKRGGAEADD